jgi:predicted RND superfamily exporter protein
MAPRGAQFIGKLAELIIRFRVPIILVLTVASVLAAYYYRKVPRDPSVEAMVLEDDPDLVAYKQFKEIFGNDEFILIVTQVPDIFDTAFMEKVESLRTAVEQIPHIKDAVAYTNVKTIRGTREETEDGTEYGFVVEKLIPEIPRSPEAMAALRSRALAETDYAGSLYSHDGRTLAIMARLAPLTAETDTTETRTLITQAARELVAKAPYDTETWYVAGVPVLKSDLVETQKRESKKFEIMIFLLLTLMLYIILRTISGTLVTLIAVQASIFMLMAAHYFSGIPLTMVSSILTPLMMVYGVSSSVHIQTHYALRSRGVINPRSALVASVAVTFIPCLFNSATTAVGFGSNMISTIKPISEFAMFASAGIAISFLLSFLLIPTILSFFKKPGRSTHNAHEKGLRVHVLEGIIRLVQAHHRKIVVVTILLMAVSVYGMTLIKVETKLLEYFKKDSPIRTAYDFIETNLTGISAIEVMIDTGKKDGMKDPEVIAALEKLADTLRESEPDLAPPMSLENFYKRINQALNAEDPAFRTIPQSRQEAGQYLMLYSMSGSESDLYNFTSRDYRYGRLSTRIVKTLSSSELQELVERLKSQVSVIFEDLSKKGVSVHATGSAVLYANMNSSLILGQLESFGLSLLLVSIMMILVAGEIGLGLVSLLPNLMPIIMTMGIMGFMGYSLDSTTTMIAPIALGMAVDSTIHFMVRFRREYLARGDYQLAANETVRLIGRAMIGTSMPLAAGFFVLTTSEFLPVFVFGLLSGIVVLLAMAFDLILTPIVMMMYRPQYKKTGLVDFFD